MGVNTSIGPATRLWQDAASELTPAKSLARINDNAKFLAGSVTIVGTLFTGFGLLTIDRLRADGLPFGVALVAGCVAVLAVLVALASLVLRMKTLRISNLREVEDWYKGQLKRGAILAIAGWALTFSIALSAGASGFVLLTDQAMAPTLSLQLSRTGNDTRVSGRVTVLGLAPRTMVTTEIIGVGAGPLDVILVQNESLADTTGKVDFSADIGRAENYHKFKLKVLPSGRQPMEVDLLPIS
jgi:hypothetical protein